jgi:ribosomal protein S18 acetylase RimI-like enzyme
MPQSESLTEPLPQPAAHPSSALRIRPAAATDLPVVIALDHAHTGVAKPEYWHGLYERLAQSARPRFFLVAEEGGVLRGFIIGEVRAWEFGSEPCGWIFAIGVDAAARVSGIGSRLFAAVCACFKQAGVTKVRTMLRRDASLLMSFFRSQGMMAGPFLQLDMDIDDVARANPAGSGRP